MFTVYLFLIMHIFRYSRSWRDTSWPNSSVFREFNFTAGHFIGHNCYIQPSQWLGDLEWNQEPVHEWLHVAESVNANLVNDLDERKDEEKDVNWLYMKTWFGKLNFYISNLYFRLCDAGLWRWQPRIYRFRANQIYHTDI